MLYPTALVEHWPPTRPPLTRRDRFGLAGLLALTTILTLARLGAGATELATDDEQCTKWPPYQTTRCAEMIPLDEVHYVPDARDVLRFGTESDTRVPTEDDGAYVVHPPLGKMVIAAGIAVLGDRPEGWRIGGALFGIAGVLILFALARRLFGDARWALLAAGLLAIDGLWLTMSRVAMLDIVAATFTLAGVWAAIEIAARAVEARGRAFPLLGAGVAFGAALATKWSTGSYIALGVIIILSAELAAWRRRVTPPAVDVAAFGIDALDTWVAATVAQPVARRAGGPRRVLASLLAGSALPLALYTASFTPWFLSEDRYVPPACEGRSSVSASWLCYQREVLSFHRNLEKYEEVAPDAEEPTATATLPAPGEDTGPTMQPAHPYFGHAITWPWIGRPVVHNFYETDGRNVEVMGVPNPIVWWFGFFAAIPWLAARARRDRTARFIFAAIVAGWGPYLLADLVARPVFFFYATPLVPFVILGSVALGRRLREGSAAYGPTSFGRGAVVGGVVAAIVTAAWLYPIHAAIPLEPGRAGWGGRILFQTDCTEPGIKVLCWV